MNLKMHDFATYIAPGLMDRQMAYAMAATMDSN
jgi:hypothetical protein